MVRQTVLATTEARDQLSELLRRFRRQGARAAPVLLGDHRKPEAVLVSLPAWERLEALAEQAKVDAAPEVQERVRILLDDPSETVTVKRRAREHA